MVAKPQEVGGHTLDRQRDDLLRLALRVLLGLLLDLTKRVRGLGDRGIAKGVDQLLLRLRGGEAGEPPDLDFGVRLIELYDAWRNTVDRYEKSEIIEEMLDIQVDQITSIGVVQGVLQPVVVSNRLQNVPGEGIYSWDPGAHFGMYRPDTFWLSD